MPPAISVTACGSHVGDGESALHRSETTGREPRPGRVEQPEHTTRMFALLTEGFLAVPQTPLMA
eukprot:5312741-Pleurochrysis_carterae.AAC.1